MAYERVTRDFYGRIIEKSGGELFHGERHVTVLEAIEEAYGEASAMQASEAVYGNGNTYGTADGKKISFEDLAYAAWF